MLTSNGCPNDARCVFDTCTSSQTARHTLTHSHAHTHITFTFALPRTQSLQEEVQELQKSSKQPAWFGGGKKALQQKDEQMEILQQELAAKIQENGKYRYVDIISMNKRL